MDERTAYYDDFYGWSQDQAEVLRSMRDRPGLPNGLDLEHVIEEIEGVGSSQLSSVQSYVRLIFVHLIKTSSTDNEDTKGHWREEIANFHADLLTRYSRSMRQHVDLPLLWRRALDQAEIALDRHGEAVAPGLREACPYDLDDLLVERIDIDGLLSRAHRAGESGSRA